MKLAVFAHCTIDTISINDSKHEQVGGPACYCGVMAREFKFDVNLYTKFGNDFPKQYLIDKMIKFSNSQTQTPTTRFTINISNGNRVLILENKCDDIQYDNTKYDSHMDTDGCIISPICNEINHDTFNKIKKDSKFTLLDPQGFLRYTDNSNKVILKNSDIDLSNIDAIKVNPDEGNCLTGSMGDDILKSLYKKIKHVIFTNKAEISMLAKDKIYTITLPNKEIHDTTGIGDIFCAAFCCTILKEKDFLWALCFAGGAAQAALNSKGMGLSKIPKKGEIETNASYFYNLIKFRNI